MFSSAIDRAVEQVRRLQGHPDWHRVGILCDRWIETRYVNVPAEAFPFLSSRADGCHYALWIDDPLQDHEPPVVWISPADGTPETVELVAASAAELPALFPDGDAGYWPIFAKPSMIQARLRAIAARDALGPHPTRDGMGVLAKTARGFTRPSADDLASWLRPDPSLLFAKLAAWIDSGAPELALVVLRDAIADHAPDGIAGFGAACGRAYRALDREPLACVAEATYGRRAARK